MFKRKKNLAPSPVSTISIWQRLKRRFSFKKMPLETKNEAGKTPLPDISIEELELELTKKTKPLPDIEIAFINPETGELEIVHLPQETFQTNGSQNFTQVAIGKEPIFTLELEAPRIPKKKEDDPTKRITHFPSNRLH